MFGCFGRGAGDELVAGRVRRLGGGDVKRGAVSQPSMSTSRETLERSMQRFYGRNLSSAVVLGVGTCDWPRKTSASMGVRGWRDRDEDMGGWNRRRWCKILHFVVWDVEGQDEIWPMRRQNYWGTDGLIRVVDSSNRTRTRRTMRQCLFPAVEQELSDAVAAAEITEKLACTV